MHFVISCLFVICDVKMENLITLDKRIKIPGSALIHLVISFHSACPKVELSKTTGTVSSFNYPGGFSGNIDCRWILKAPHEESAIHFVFQDFQLDTCDPRLPCLRCGSIVQAYETSLLSKIIAYQPWCRNDAPKLTFFHGSQLKLKFQTNFRTQGKGFVAKYRYVRKNLGKNITLEYSNFYYSFNNLVKFVRMSFQRYGIWSA
jgi:hypothetical protein